MLVATRFNVTFLPLRLCYENTRPVSRKMQKICLRPLMQSDSLYLSLFFEHYNRILLCEGMIELCSIRLIDGVPCHNTFAFVLDLTNLGIWRPTPQ